MVGQSINDVRLGTMLKIFTLLAGVGLTALAIYKFARLRIIDPRDFFLTCYYIIFGVLIALSEMPCKSLMNCFSFLGFYIGKAIFCIFLGTIVFDPNTVYFLILAIVFWCVGILYFVLACSCKKKIVEAEDAEAEKPQEGEAGFKPVNLQSDANQA